MEQNSGHDAPAAVPIPHPSLPERTPAPGPAARPGPLPPIPVVAPHSAQMHDSPEQNPAGSPPPTPSILRMPSPNFPAGTAQAHHDHSSNATAGPSNIAKQKQVASPNHSSEEDNAQTPGERAFSQPSSRDRNPEDSERHQPKLWYVQRRLRKPPIPSVIDHVVPTVSAPPHAAGNGIGRRTSVAATSQATLALNGEKKVEDRLKPTLDAAKAERDRVALKGACTHWSANENVLITSVESVAKAHAWALNVAIGAQVVLGLPLYGYVSQSTKTIAAVHIARPPPWGSWGSTEYKEKSGSGYPSADLPAPCRRCRRCRKRRTARKAASPTCSR
ncbi:hypothetical protein NUW54_g14038 [Trametes sanguinea]|uniref:Uncharacterized protein n=1 Tax=Trametes sanguinea TaxID=158606 RepID=A0ACC1MFW7_9APHY|nr:hypothetical protein NUW54_g14038 [Trametes sanguinea]